MGLQAMPTLKWRAGPPRRVCGFNEETWMRMRIKHALKIPLSQPVLPPPPDPGAQCQQKVTCQTDTPGYLGKGTPRGPRSTLWTCFSLLSSSQSRGCCGGKWKGEQGPRDWAERKVWGAGSRKSDTRCRVGAWKPILRNFTLPPRAGIGNFYELFFNRKKSRRWWAAEKTWARPKSASLVPNLALGWGPCRNLLEFSVSLLSLMCKPTLYLLPKQMRTLGDTACGRALSARAHQMWGVVDNEKSFRQKNSLEIWRR